MLNTNIKVLFAIALFTFLTSCGGDAELPQNEIEEYFIEFKAGGKVYRQESNYFDFCGASFYLCFDTEAFEINMELDSDDSPQTDEYIESLQGENFSLDFSKAQAMWIRYSADDLDVSSREADVQTGTGQVTKVTKVAINNLGSNIYKVEGTFKGRLGDIDGGDTFVDATEGKFSVGYVGD